MIDGDCDGYGVGSPLGPDADDGDPTVNTAASMIAKYDPVNQDPFVALQNFLPARRGFNPRHYVFISTTGVDSTCAVNNIALPCASFSKANSLAVPGDAIVWRAGTYVQTTYIQFTRSGTASNPMIYMAYPGEQVILSWKVDADGLEMGGLSYWTIDGLVLTQTSTLGYGINYTQGFNVFNGTIQNTEILGFYDGLFLQNGLNNLTIQNSYIHTDSAHLGQEHNVYLGCSALTCPNLVFRNNIIADSPAGGHNLHINGRFPNALVDSNEFYGGIGDCLGLQMGVNNSLFQNNFCHTVVSAAIWLIDYSQNSNASIQCHNQNYNVFRNNTFIDDGQSWNQGVNGNDGTQPVYRVTDQCAATDYGPDFTHDLGHNTFDSNIFVHWCSFNCAGHVVQYDGAAAAGWLGTDTWRNNVLWNVNASANIIQVNGAHHDWSWFSNPSNVPGSGNVNANPMFIAANPTWAAQPNNWNLALQPGSPAVNTSFAGDLPPLDLLGNCRMSASAAGAYEFGARGCPSGGAVVNAASELAGPIAPGELVVLFGTGMGPAQLTSYSLDASGLIATQVAGTSVFFNNIPAPILYTEATAVGAIVPYSLTGTTVQISVVYQGATVVSTSASLAAAAPALFTLDQSGQGQAAAVNQDGSVNGGDSPAQVGGLISLFLTGSGQTAPRSTDVGFAGAAPPPPGLPVTVTIGGQPAQVQYAGGAPFELTGLMQINVFVPTGIGTNGPVPITVQVGTASSPPGVTIYVAGN
jgi:uncharacterized protein (TIGR03437 family)